MLLVFFVWYLCDFSCVGVSWVELGSLISDVVSWSLDCSCWPASSVCQSEALLACQLDRWEEWRNVAKIQSGSCSRGIGRS